MTRGLNSTGLMPRMFRKLQPGRTTCTMHERGLFRPKPVHSPSDFTQFSWITKPLLPYLGLHVSESRRPTGRTNAQTALPTTQFMRRGSLSMQCIFLSTITFEDLKLIYCGEWNSHWSLKNKNHTHFIYLWLQFLHYYLLLLLLFNWTPILWVYFPTHLLFPTS